ncbi:hypothetical protein A9264_12220 [Vibrio sp. UCD-FRSSP16_10]|uniref:response regulator n=1 Tax=unclassified Vibrio TaxID=2614977 RepID=UPI0008006F91|nr:MULTISPECIES: transporter substrate-binding domain-containing protein [unclassified Vibrio]OBT16022.1 hypothetical protein A9260_12435 [Vibrio sp. UCD-FRSSP16_30]OBT21104.1 hypothetical protein A9264_12220 [Vibrio sp. UCD-FRSSP16_10]
MSFADIQFSEDERSWLRKGQQIKVAVFDNHYPYIYLNDRGEYAGIVNDYLQYIEKNTDIDFVEVPVSNLDDAYRDTENGIIDLYPMTFDFKDSKLDLAYTTAYLPYHYFVFTNISANIDPNPNSIDAQTLELAVIKGSAVERYLDAHTFSFTRKYFVDDRSALKALDEGKVDAYIGEKVSSESLIQGLNLNRIKPLRSTKELYGMRLQMAVHPEATQLLSIINKSLMGMPYDIQNGIMAHWFDHQPFKNKLNGYLYFNRTPYTFIADSAIGLEFSILQDLFESMGYESGNLAPADKSFDYSQKLLSDNMDYVATQFLSEQDIKNDNGGLDKNGLYYSEPYLTQEYRLISRLDDKISFESVVDKQIGMVAAVNNIVASQAIKMLETRFGQNVDERYSDLSSALNELQNKEIDYLLVDSREFAVHLARSSSDLRVNITHDQNTRFRIPLRVAFRDPILRDKFNAELVGFMRSSKYRRLEKLYENANFQAKAQSSALLADIVSYLIQVNRLELIDRVLEAFSFSDGFNAIALQVGDNPNHILKYTNKNGQLLKVDEFSRQGLVYLIKPLLRGDGIEQVAIGELTIYSELDSSASFNQNYIPPLSIFEGASSTDYDNIRKIYERANLHVFSLNLTAAELEWIKHNPVIPVGIDPGALPYEGVQNGEYRGIVADILQEMSEKVGVTFEPIMVNSWRETVDKIEANEIPMVSAAMENKSMSYDYVTSLPLFTDQLAVAGHTGVEYSHGLESFNGRRVGIHHGASNTPALMDNYPEIDWVMVDSSAIGLEMLSKEQLDGYVDTSYVINFIFNEHSYRNLSIVDRLNYTVTPTFHTLKSRPILGSIVTKAVRSISASQKQQIINNWASSRVIEKVDYRMILIVSSVLLLVLSVFYISNRRLKKQVAATKAAQQEALASRNRLFDILNTSSIAVIIVQNERIAYSNNRALEQFKLTSEESYGYFISRIYVDSIDREDVYQELDLKGKLIDREMVFQREDSTQFTALCSFYLIDYHDEPAVLFWSYDISEIKKLNQELADATMVANIANQTKSNFLANMSHEIRTPMNAIIGMSYLALEGELNRKARNYIGKVHQSAQSLLLIINDILDISKIESGKLEIEQRSFSLKDMLRDIANVLSFRIAEKNVDFIFNIDSSIPRMVIGDELRLSQVLINLGNNATKFTEEGEILICLEASPIQADKNVYRYHFMVQDTGIGIAQNKVDTLFESFQQADVSTTREYGGTGLGLSISKQIIELMGGKIWVESQLGIGSSFHFEVELEIADSNHGLLDDARLITEKIKHQSLFIVEPTEKGVQALNSALAAVEIEAQVTHTYMQLLDLLRKSNGREHLIYIADPALACDLIQMQQELATLAGFGRILLSSANEDRCTLARKQGIEILPRPWLPFELLSQLSGVNVIDHDLQISQQRDDKALLDGMRVLLVEDNQLNQELVLGLLESYGLDIDVVENGLLAVEKAKHHQYAIILMDIQMPVLGGYQATEQIRQFDKVTPIIAMTANAMVGDKEKATAAGMNGYIAKPIEVTRLIQVLVNAAKQEHDETVSSALPMLDSGLEPTSDPEPISDLSNAPILSVVQGLQTCNQNLSLYIKLMKTYLVNAPLRIADFESALNDANWEVALRELHTLKGTSASIGALAIAQLCTNNEQQYSLTPEQLSSQLEPLRHSLDNTLAEIKSYLEQVELKQSEALAKSASNKSTSDADLESDKGDLSECNYDELHEQIKYLGILVDNYDLQALEKVQVLREQHSQAELLQLFDKLESSLSTYQFDVARSAIDDWITRNTQ